MAVKRTLDWRRGSTFESTEGELTYHARVWEGGCSAFIKPSTGEVFLIDNGRICKYDSFYRNDLGEVFSESKTKTWENFYLNE
jgi:hypothetical protein